MANSQISYTVAKGVALLADCSSSMDYTTRSGKRRIDHLAVVLGYVLSRVKLQTLIAFNSVPVEIEIGPKVKLPEPYGSTDLALALTYVAELAQRPERLIVLCDGEPNDPELAIRVAGTLGIPIDAYFCADDDFTVGQKFMARLSAAGAEGGRSGNWKFGEDQMMGEALRLTVARR